MTDAELREDLIAKGLLRPLSAWYSGAILTTDFAGRRAAARDILFGEGRRVASEVDANRHADPVVRELLRRWLGQRLEAAA